MPNRLIDETSRTCSSTPTTRSTGTPGARRRWPRPRRGPADLLSIGYSACHWCHVMERESFEDPEIARLMNELFVNIKVDREERPDLDGIYMQAVQALTGQGGWPMTVFDAGGGAVLRRDVLPPGGRGHMRASRACSGVAEACGRGAATSTRTPSSSSRCCSGRSRRPRAAR